MFFGLWARMGPNDPCSRRRRSQSWGFKSVFFGGPSWSHLKWAFRGAIESGVITYFILKTCFVLPFRLCHQLRGLDLIFGGTQTGTKTNVYQNFTFSKLKELSILMPHQFSYSFMCFRTDTQTGTKTNGYQNQRTCHFDTPSALIPLWGLLSKGDGRPR